MTRSNISWNVSISIPSSFYHSGCGEDHHARRTYALQCCSLQTAWVSWLTLSVTLAQMARNHQGGVTWLAQGHSPARAWLCVCVTVPAQKEAVSPLPIPLSGPLSQTLELWAWRPVCCGLPVQRIRATSPIFYTYQLTLPLTPPIPR